MGPPVPTKCGVAARLETGFGSRISEGEEIWREMLEATAHDASHTIHPADRQGETMHGGGQEMVREMD